MDRGDVIGREEELAALDVFLDRVPSGFAALVLTGEAGVGKTTLRRAGIEAAYERSFRVLAASPGAAETGMSFATLGDLVADALDEVLPRLPSPQRRALEIALLLAEVEDARPEQHAVAVAFLNGLRALSTSGPVLVAVDDVQWLDSGSANVLAYAGRRLREERIGLLLTERAAEPSPPPLDLERGVADDRITSILIGPLTLGALHRLLHERLGLVVPRPILRRVHETANGNPLYAIEIARALELEGVTVLAGEPLQVPHSLSELVRNRVAALPTDTREALLVAAALSEARLAVVGAALKGDAATALRPALDAGVITAEGDRIRFAHPLLASTAYGLAESSVRRDVHRRLAAAVGELEGQARHLALAAEGPDEAVATVLERAAEHAHARGATAAAAGLSEHACRLTPLERPDDVHRRRMAGAQYHFAAGDMGRARTLLEDVVASARAGGRRAEALTMLARLNRYQGDQPKAAELASAALAETGAGERVRAEAANELATTLFFMREDLENARHHAALAAELATAVGDLVLHADSLATKSIVEVLLGRPEAAATMEAASKLADPVAEWRVLAWPSYARAVFLLWTDKPEEATVILRGHHETAARRGDDSALPLTLANLALADYLVGRWQDAARIAEEGYEVALQVGQRPQQGYSLSTRALVRASLGLEDEARADAEAALVLAGARGMAVSRIHALWALGLLELSLGRPAETAQLLAPLRKQLLAAGVGEPGTIRFVPDEIEALIVLGRLDEAETLLGWLEERGRALDRASAIGAAERCRGLLLAARQDVTAAFASFERALVEHERVPMQFERARTLLALGAAQRRAKRKRDARGTLGQALATFEGLGAAIWARRAREELERISGRAPSRDELTPTERRVVELVAEGRTNPEVAAALVVSPRTVEFHLRNVFRKLDVHSRGEIVRRFGRLGDPTVKP